MGLKRSVLLALLLMGVSNASFALLAMYGHSNLGLAGAMAFENIASGIGGVVVGRLFLGALQPALHRGRSTR